MNRKICELFVVAVFAVTVIVQADARGCVQNYCD